MSDTPNTSKTKTDHNIRSSTGWGGRILGAMSCKMIAIFTILVLINPDNFYDDDARSKYADIADFYNEKTYRVAHFSQEEQTPMRFLDWVQ